MPEPMVYEAPAILELGDASALTLGYPNREICDGCDCTKDNEVETL